MSENIASDRKDKISIWPRILLLAFALAMGLGSIAGKAFTKRDEPRVAGIAWEMALENEYATPRLNGVPFLEYPSLGYMPIVGLFELTGRNTPFVAHAATALMGLGTVFFIFLLGRVLGGESVGLAAAFVLQATFGFLNINSRLLVDPSLLFWITMSLYGFLAGYRAQKYSFAYFSLFYLGMAGGFLSKGLLGLGLPGLIAAIFILMRKDFVSILKMRPWWGVLVFALPIALWTWGLYCAEGSAMLHEVWRQSLQRFFSSSADHHRSPFFYFDVVFYVLFPWTAFLPFVLWRYFAPAHLNQTKKADKRAQFPKAWFAVVFVVLSIASAKRNIYIAPIFPAFALLMALWWDEAKKRERHRLENILLLSLPYLGMACLIAAVVIALVQKYFVLGAILTILSVLAGAFLYLRRAKLMAFGPGMAFYMLCVVIMAGAAHYAIEIPKSHARSLAPFFSAVKRDWDQQIVLYRPSESMRGAAYFHLGHNVPVIENAKALQNAIRQSPGLLVATKNPDLAKLGAKLKPMTLEIVLQIELKRRRKSDKVMLLKTRAAKTHKKDKGDSR